MRATSPHAGPATLDFDDREAAKCGARSLRRDRHPRVEAFLDAPPPGARVPDLGCGIGRAAARLAERGFAAEALGPSAGLAAAEIARDRARMSDGGEGTILYATANA
ncbi:MAG: class I SAM-dependent methyltransferase [Pseudomonadota bacterium]